MQIARCIKYLSIDRYIRTAPPKTEEKKRKQHKQTSIFLFSIYLLTFFVCFFLPYSNFSSSLSPKTQPASKGRLWLDDKERKEQKGEKEGKEEKMRWKEGNKRICRFYFPAGYAMFKFSRPVLWQWSIQQIYSSIDLSYTHILCMVMVGLHATPPPLIIILLPRPSRRWTKMPMFSIFGHKLLVHETIKPI